MSRFRLGVFAPDIGDGTSTYRAAGPLSHLARHVMRELEFAPILEPLEWYSFMSCDAIFIQRPHSYQALDIIRLANDMRIPVWMDVDDDMQALPPGHRSFLAYQKAAKDIPEIFQRANVISCSTQALADKMKSQTSAKIFVIPNAVDETLGDPAPTRALDPKFLAWRGSDTHREDIELARDLFTDPGIKMHYFGHTPPWLRNGDTITPWLAPHRFLRELPYTPAGVMVVPLLDNAFNRAKSNCSWLEATWAGLATAHWTNDITPLPEFDKPGVLTRDQFELATPESLAIARDKSLSFILDNLTLESVNLQRAELLRNL